MSAQLANGELSNRFSAHLVLAAGVTASIHAPSLADLQSVVGKLQPTTPANDPQAGKSVKDMVKPAPSPAAPQVQPAGNASASTGTQASAPPAGNGSEAGGDKAHTYDDVKDRVLKLSKVSRETALGLLAKFTGPSGQPCDHGNKLQLPDYPAFVQQADEILKAAGK